MERLNIYLFGEPRIYFNQRPAFRFPTQKSLELMAYAALSAGNRISRERIATSLRDEVSDTQSRKALSTDLWRIRQLFADVGIDSTDYFHADRNTLGFRKEAPVYVDVNRFDQTAEKALKLGSDGLTPEIAAELKSALSLYQDDLLPVVDCEWCLILREKLRARYSACLDLLLSYELEQNTWPRALVWAERLVELDPLLEHGHRAAMQCHFLMGNRGAAIRQYGICASLLHKELGIEPAEETQRMYRGLLSVPPQQQNTTKPQPAKPKILEGAGRIIKTAEQKQPLTDQLAMALGNLNTARSFIENVDTRLRRGER